MQLPIYSTLKEFKDCYTDVFWEFPQLKGNQLKLLREYLIQYNKELETAFNFLMIPNAILFDGMQDLIDVHFALVPNLKIQLLTNGFIEADEYIIDPNSPMANKQLEDVDQMNRNFIEFTSNIESHADYDKVLKYDYSYIIEVYNIINYVSEEIKTIKENFKFIPQFLEPEEHQLEPEPILTNKQIEKIGLFVRSGIINFLRESNPGINDSQIARFLRELTSDHLENAEAVRQHLTSNIENIKHPLYKDGAAQKYDLILNKFGISPV